MGAAPGKRGPKGPYTDAQVVMYSLSRLGISVVLIDKAAFPRQKLCAGFLTLNTVRLLVRLGSLTRMLFGDGPRAETPVFMGLSGRYISGLGTDFGASHPPTEGPWGLADFA